jgi:hypothetical protein
MPKDGKILGFTNSWYDFAMTSAREFELPDGTAIRLISAPAFIATKLEAFHDRGRGDPVASHDLEDIIAVIDGRPELGVEINETDASVSHYICECFARLLDNPAFVDSIAMNLLPDEESQARGKIIIERISAIARAK